MKTMIPLEPNQSELLNFTLPYKEIKVGQRVQVIFPDGEAIYMIADTKGYYQFNGVIRAVEKNDK